jgi:hypothetical protein
VMHCLGDERSFTVGVDVKLMGDNILVSGKGFDGGFVRDGR